MNTFKLRILKLKVQSLKKDKTVSLSAEVNDYTQWGSLCYTARQSSSTWNYFLVCLLFAKSVKKKLRLTFFCKVLNLASKYIGILPPYLAHCGLCQCSTIRVKIYLFFAKLCLWDSEKMNESLCFSTAIQNVCFSFS